MMKTFVLLAAALTAVSAWEFMLPMRDGVKLHTVVNLPLDYTPGDEKNYTVIMDRSPYGQDALELLGFAISQIEGVISLRQDQRGAQKSQGNFTLWHNAANDTQDTAAWVTKQPWSNGKVLSFGASADGLASFAAMAAPPPSLNGQWIVFSAAEGHTSVVYPGGAYRKALTEFWIESTLGDQAAALIEEVKQHEAPGPWWTAGLDLRGKWGNFLHPVTMWAGWYDIFLAGNLLGYDGVKNSAGTAVAREKTTLFIDPCGHCQDAGDVYYRNTIAGRSVLPLLQGYNLFHEEAFPSLANPIAPLIPDNVSALTFYVMGADSLLGDDPGGYWTSLPDWPTFKPTPYYMHKDGSLSTAAPSADEGSSTYKYDPTDPVPSMGGNNLKIKCGPEDQRPVEAPKRSDVLTFTSEALKEAVAVTGPLVANISVSSDMVDTDFTVKITDVYPDGGDSRLIQDGIIRMRWREGGNMPKNMTAGTVYSVQVSLWATSYVFAPRHQIRVSVSSSNYPRFGPNPNNGWPLDLNGPNNTATNTLYHGSDHPSSFILPVVSLSQLPNHDSTMLEIQNRVDAADPQLKAGINKLMDSVIADSQKWV